MNGDTTRNLVFVSLAIHRISKTTIAMKLNHDSIRIRQWAQAGGGSKKQEILVARWGSEEQETLQCKIS